MIFRYIATVFLLFSAGTAATVKATEQLIPEQVYQGLEYAISLPQTKDQLDPVNLSTLIDFMLSVDDNSAATLKERQGAAGAFYSFHLKTDLNRILDYVYNPDIPHYITSPSSLRDQEWLTPRTEQELKELPKTVESEKNVRLLRGRERESITPDTNTGGYYSYDQQRALAILPGPTGTVIVSVSSQPKSSDVGKKGCVVGDDKNWNYLFSGETGLNKMGLGWVQSYMYHANSVIIYLLDPSGKGIRVGSFKWLNAGWKTINMVKSSHILNGIKRFAADFKTVLESPDLPAPSVLADKYQELLYSTDHQLREKVAPYLDGIIDMGSSAVCSTLFKKQLLSGQYLNQIDRDEMIRILLLEYMKDTLGKEVLVSTHAQADRKKVSSFN